jgi:HD-GYP domain-containing protein (c-di-GMP phosphodiesterase class II)
MKSAPHLPPQFYWFVLAVWLLALATVAVTVRYSPVVTATQANGVLIALALVVFIALAGAMPLALSPMVKIHVGTAPLFAATLLFPVPIAACIGLVGTVAAHTYLQSRRRRTWQDLAFNGGRTVLQVALAGALFHSLARGQEVPAVVAASSLALAATLSGLAYYLVNVTAVYSATGLLTGRNPLRLWWSSLRLEGPQQAALLLFGVVTAVVVSLFPMLGLAMVFPVSVVYSSLRTSATMRTQTQPAVEAIADAVDMRAFGASGHSRRVADLAARLAVRLGLNAHAVELVRRAARVHDIGKVGFSDAVLRRDGTITPAERLALRMHPAYGAEILAPFAEYQQCRHLVRLHHERPDGAGYPEGRAGSQIPLGAAIIAVAEAFDTLTTDRPHRPAIAPAQACVAISAGADTCWNARVVHALLAEVQEKAPQPAAAGGAVRVGARL